MKQYDDPEDDELEGEGEIPPGPDPGDTPPP